MDRGSPKRAAPSSIAAHEILVVGANLTNRRERIFGALAELRRRWAKFPSRRNDSNSDPFRFSRQTHESNTIIERVIERIRGKGYADAGADRGKNTRPPVVLLHEARLVVHASEDRIQIFQITRIVLSRQPNERFARRIR